MSEPLGMNERQEQLVIDAVQKNSWWSATPGIRVEVWSNFRQSQDLLRNYLCKDGSGYIRGYYDDASTLYVKKFHLRDEEWTDPQSSQPEEAMS